MKHGILRVVVVALAPLSCIVAVPSAQAATPAFSFNVTNVVFHNVPLDTKVSTEIQIKNTTKVARTIDYSSNSPDVFLNANVPAQGSTVCTYAPGGGIQIKAGGWCKATVYFDGRGLRPGGRSHSLSIFPAGSPELGKSLPVRASVLFPYTVTPGSLDYGNVTAKGARVARSVTIKNTSGGVLDLSLNVIGEFSGFSYVDFNGSTCGTKNADGNFSPYVVLKLNATCKFAMKLGSGEQGDHSFAFGVEVAKSIGGTTTYNLSSIPVRYRSIPPSFTLNPKPVDFGTVAVGATTANKTITLKNTSTVDEYFDVNVAGFQSADIHRGANKCAGPIAPARTCTVVFSVTPHLGGPQSGLVTVDVLDQSGDYVSGASQEFGAKLKTTAPTYTITPASIWFGTVNYGDIRTKEVTVKNTSKSDQAVRINSNNLPEGVTLEPISSRCDIGFPRVLEPGTSCLLYVRFTPTADHAVSGYLFVDLVDAAGSGIPGSSKAINIKGTPGH